MAKVKISVVKTFDIKDVFEVLPKTPENYLSSCYRHKAGDTFISVDGNKPEGFCSWAFADIQRDITLLRFGTDIPGMERGVLYSACTDGLRPVIFKLERLEE